jgi:hypothetical protein
MSLQSTRLDLAVRVTERVLRDAPDAPLDARLAAFHDAYATLAALDAGDTDWTAETLTAAWALTDDAFPHGGAVGDVLGALSSAHRMIAQVATAPPPDRPAKPRRDA